MASEQRTLLASTLGGIIRQLRQDCGLSQEDLAFEAGIDRTYVSMLERGVRVPTVVTLFQLAGPLNVSVSRLMALLEAAVDAPVR